MLEQKTYGFCTLVVELEAEKAIVVAANYQLEAQNHRLLVSLSQSMSALQVSKFGANLFVDDDKKTSFYTKTTYICFFLCMSS